MKEAMWKRVCVVIGSVLVPVLLFTSLVGLVRLSSEDVEASWNTVQYPVSLVSIKSWVPNTNYWQTPTQTGSVHEESGAETRLVIYAAKQDMTDATAIELQLYFEYCDPCTTGDVYIQRVTREFVLNEVTWNSYSTGNAWTSPGGDFTATNKVTAAVPTGSEGIRTYDVTDLVSNAWVDDDEDFYGIVMAGDNWGGDGSFSFRNETTGSKKSHMAVTYTDEVLGESYWVDVPRVRVMEYLGGGHGQTRPAIGGSSSVGALARTILEVPRQGDVSRVESVTLRLRTYSTEYDSSVGREMQVCRVTRIPNMEYASAYYYDLDKAWTNYFGDFTTSGRSFATGVAVGEYVDLDVTAMAKVAWAAGEDLYALLMWRNEKPAGTAVFGQYFYGTEDGASRPAVFVEYEGEVPEPSVAVTLSWASDVSAGLLVNPNRMEVDGLQARLEYNKVGEASWGSTTAWLDVESDISYEVVVEGLTVDTEYVVRGAITDGIRVNYSASVEFSTADYVWPKVDKAVISDVGVTWAQVTVNYDREGGGNGIGWLEVHFGKWWVKTASRTIAIDDDYVYTLTAEWLQEHRFMHPGCGTEEAVVRGVFERGGVRYYGAEEDLVFLEQPAIEGSVDAYGAGWFRVAYDVTINDGSPCELTLMYERVDGVGARQYKSLGTYTMNKSGEKVTVDGLVELVGWKYAFIRNVEDYDMPWCDAWDQVHPSSLEVHPEITTVGATVKGTLVEFEAEVTLHDAAMLPHSLYFEFFVPASGVIQRTEELTELSDGRHVVTHRIGGDLAWDTNYDYRAVINYVVGERKGEVKVLQVPEERLGVANLGVEDQTETTVVLVGDLQLAGHEKARMRWMIIEDLTGEMAWESGFFERHESGEFRRQAVGLSAGVRYRSMLWVTYPDQLTTEYFYWVQEVEQQGVIPWWPKIPGIDNLVLKLIASVFLTVVGGALVMWKLRGRSGQLIGAVTVVGCMSIFGAMGWMPVWTILLLSLGLAGMVLYQLKGGGAGNEA